MDGNNFDLRIQVMSNSGVDCGGGVADAADDDVVHCYDVLRHADHDARHRRLGCGALLRVPLFPRIKSSLFTTCANA